MLNQIAIYLENRKGRVFSVTKTLKDSGVDMIALTLAEGKDFGILRIITRDNEKAVNALRGAGFTIISPDFIGVEVADKPGGLYEVLECLDAADINIEYIFSHRTESGALIFMRVSNEQKAIDVLTAKGVKILQKGAR
ncbi:MAG: hypothetical protein FWH03_04725 [Firmicutes bacterium]|nr:hypothetical protein [Bacillota bacterium]